MKSIFLTMLSFYANTALAALFCERRTQIGDTVNCCSIGWSDNRLINPLLPLDTLDKKTLHTVVLKNCRLRTLSKAGLEGLQDVATLDMSHNRLATLPDDLFVDTNNLVTLNLSSNILASLGATIFVPLRNLRVLDLSRNALIVNAVEPTFLVQQPNLRILDVSENCEVDVEELVHNVQQLKVLKLTKVRVRLDRAPSNLTRLTHLNVGNGRISSLFEGQLNSLKNLISVDMSNNSINKIPKNYFVSIRLSVLNLSRNSLRDVENAFSNNVNLLIVDLSFNKLTHILKTTFKNNAKLLELNLSNNNLMRVSAVSFRQLVELRVLNLAKNNFSELDTGFFTTNKKLNVLNLDKNNIKTIPDDTLDTNEELRILTLSNNYLENFPQRVLNNVSKLHTLDLANNSLNILDIKIDKLKDLRIACNDFTDMPQDLENRKTPISITLHGNPFHCACVQDILEIAKNNINVKIEKKNFNDGNFPVCIWSPTRCKFSERDTILYKEWFKRLLESDVC